MERTNERMINLQRRRAHGKVRFALVIVLTKGEAFEACEICADVERALLRAGRAVEAARVATLFELFESRLTVG
jgi:hypothetical protein